MAASYIRTNLGKWGRQCQTFWEHGHLTHVFRRTLNYPAIVTLKSTVKCNDMEQLINNYLSLTTVEDYFHDYDKLYVPEDMLNSVDMTKFKGHGDIYSERNKVALQMLMEDLDANTLPHVRGIMGDIQQVLSVSEDFLQRVLRAANFSHEGDRTPEKFSMVAGVLKEFVEAHGCIIDEAFFIDFARIHMFTLRVADSIASAYRKPAFKSDVTEYLNIIDQKLGRYVFHISSVAFNPVFIESLRYDVTKGYFHVYNRVYNVLDEYVRDKGVIIEDKLSLIVAVWLGPEERAVQRMLLQLVDRLDISDVWKDIFHLDDCVVDPRENPKGFDVEIRSKMLEMMLKEYPSTQRGGLMPCNSCGRPAVDKVWKSLKELATYIGEEATGRTKRAGEIRSLEKMGNLGYIKNVSERLYGIRSSQVIHSSIPICKSCSKLIKVWAENYSPPRKGEILLTAFIREVDRLSARTRDDMDITGEQSDVLASTLYSYHLKKLLTDEIYSKLRAKSPEKVGVSAITVPILDFTDISPSISTVIEITADESLLRVELPDRVVEYKPNYGIRIGVGPMSAGGKLWDHSVLPGVYNVESYLSRIKKAERLYDFIKALPKSRKEDLQGYLYSLIGCRRMSTAIGRILKAVPSGKERIAVKRIEKFWDSLEEAARNPGSVYDLRIILSNMRGGKNV